MPIPSWPSVPYQPLANSCKRDPLLPPIRTEMEGGNVRQRRRPGDSVSVISQTIRLTDSEFNSLESWVSASAGSGVARFTMSVWLGTSYQSKTVQFEGSGQGFPYAVSEPFPDAKDVSMTLRVFGV